MCGIVGIYLKKKNLYEKLGNYLSGMLDNMSSRGPDSAGFAIYDKKNSSRAYKYSVCFPSSFDVKKFETSVTNRFKDVLIKNISDHLVISTIINPKSFLSFLDDNYKDLKIIGYGKSIEIFKQVGNPKEIVKKFKLKKLQGSHAIGHTRMATESAITLDGSHPYSTG